MRKLLILMAAMATMVVAALPAAAAGDPATRQRGDVYLILDESDVGGAGLARFENGLSTRLRASGMTPGHAITVWWAIFNDPAGCLDPYACGVIDVIGPAFGGNADGSKVSVPYATGGVVDADGVFRARAWQPLGPADGSANTYFGDPDYGLLNPLGAEVHLVLRDHGPLIPGQEHAQVSTFDGGCDPAVNPVDGLWIDLIGTFPDAPGECNDIAFVVYPSPDTP